MKQIKSLASAFLLKLLAISAFVPAFSFLVSDHGHANAHETVKAPCICVPVEEALRVFEKELIALGRPRVVDGILYYGDSAVNNRNGLVNSVTCQTGYIAAAFVVSPPGRPSLCSQFIRVATNLATDQGASAIGTILDPESAAYKALSKGKSSFGVVRLFGNDFDAVYTPIFDKRGKILGALFVGRPLPCLPCCK